MVTSLDTQIPKRPQINQAELGEKIKFLFKALCLLNSFSLLLYGHI